MNLGDKSDMVRMESETCLNEVLTFVMLNRWIVKINIVLDFLTKIPRKLDQMTHIALSYRYKQNLRREGSV